MEELARVLEKLVSVRAQLDVSPARDSIDRLIQDTIEKLAAKVNATEWLPQ